MFCTHGEGAILYTDRGPIIDMLCGLGAISLGYAAQMSPGVFSLPHTCEVEAAELVLQYVAPWASSVRFTKTGSEACHAAYRIAKAATGRKEVWIGNWGYHGWHEWCVDVGYPTLSFDHGDDPETWPVADLAAVFIEPHRWEPVDVDWLKAVRAYCDRVGALLVFDSMIYGGRWALGGASEYFGVIPDLECFGKAIGNGQSVACVVGNDALQQHGEMVSGTYSGDVGGLWAVCDTLETYASEPVIETLWTRGTQLQLGLDHICICHPELKARMEGQPVHQRLRFDDPATGKQFAGEMAKRGVLWHPDCVNVCYAHTEDQINQVIKAAWESVEAL